MTKKNWVELFGSIIIAEFAGILGSIFTSSAIPNWYAGLIKPALNPPSWVFGPVWTTLYVLMGTAAFLIWRHGYHNRNVKAALNVYFFQLLLNAFWSIIFFGLKNLGWAFVEIIFLWIFILWTLIAFYRIYKPAGYLLIPYLAWVTFASYLNYSILLLN